MKHSVWWYYLPEAGTIAFMLALCAIFGGFIYSSLVESLGWPPLPRLPEVGDRGRMIAGIAFMVGLVCCGEVGLRGARRRSSRVARFAREKGWTFRSGWTPPAEAKGLPHFQAANLRLSDIVSGRSGASEFHLFTYLTWVHGRESDSQTMFTAVLFRREGSIVPAFQLFPEGLVSRISALLGWQDIDFEERAAFSDAFVLRGQDEPAIRNWFTPKVTDAFEKATGWSAEGLGEWILLYRYGRWLDVKDFPDFLEQAAILEAALRG